MDTNNIKSFAKEARLSLMQSVTNRLTFWSIAIDGSQGNAPEKVAGGYLYNGMTYDDTTIPDKWLKLTDRVNDKQSFLDLQEEAAYTWFNRLMVVKIMEENGYIPPTLSMVEGTSVPHLLQRAKMGKHNLTNAAEIRRLTDHISNSEDEQALQILLRHLFSTQPVLQVVFGNVPEYMDLLLPANLLAADGFLTELDQNESITSEMYQEVELIGWLYQFYISDKKDEVFRGFKNKKKARAQDIPAATQIFTPKWIVKYMVENTVGKIYLDFEQDSELKDEMKYLVTSDNQDDEKRPSELIRNLEELTLLDPAAGSGHILVVGFELLMDMYREQGYNSKKAVKEILANNIHGLDIDDRAVQLARLAILLKAASYDEGVLSGDIPIPRIYAFPQAVDFGREEISQYLDTKDEGIITEVLDALQLVAQGKNLGSTIRLDVSNKALILLREQGQLWQDKYKARGLDVFHSLFWERLSAYLPILEMLTKQYVAVVANPPYMGQKNMNSNLKIFVNKNYKRSKSDLFAVFMEVCMNLTADVGLMGMINQHSWMFLSSYEELRFHFMQNFWLKDMIHLGPRAFEELSGEVVQSTAFVFQHIEPSVSDFGLKGNYHRLVDFKSALEKENNFLSGSNFYPNIAQTNFSKIPGSPIAYWLSAKFIHLFSKKVLSDIVEGKNGMSINSKFIKIWHEVDFSRISRETRNQDENIKSGAKWFPTNKGGGFQKWFGNIMFVTDYENDGERLKEFVVNNPGDPNTKHWSRRLYNTDFHYKEVITWNKIASGGICFRVLDVGFLHSDAGPIIPLVDMFLFAFLNSIVATSTLQLMSPTLNYVASDIGNLPYIGANDNNIKELVINSIDISKDDWNSRETSWDFEKSPLLNGGTTITDSFNQWKERASRMFLKIHSNEEKINVFFINLYKLSDELDYKVPLKKITILQLELDKDVLEELEIELREKQKQEITLQFTRSVVVSQFMSYCAGLMFGRYRLNNPGLHIAHQEPSSEELESYVYNRVTVDIDDDAIIPLMGNECNFQDDVLVRLDNILTAIWSKESLTVNKNFLQECLDMTLQKFVTEKFWPYHYKTMYKKKPIYWLFTSNVRSPQKAAFKVLVYMHRMDRFTLSKIRNQYLHPHQEHLQSQYDGLSARAESLDKNEAKRLDLLGKQIIECRDFDDRIKVLANQQITFDLDDGVTENYKLFAGVVGELK